MPDVSGENTTSTSSSVQVVWAIVVMFGLTMAAVVVVLALGGPESIVLAVFGQLAAIVAVLVNLRVTARVERDTKDLRNGLLDAKVRAGVADVLPDHLVDPDYRSTGQYRRDDERRGTEH